MTLAQAANKSFAKYFLAMISGVLLGTSVVPYKPWALFFCYIPLWWVVLKKSKNMWDVLSVSLITQFVSNIIMTYWVLSSVHNFAHISWFSSLLIFIVFCLYENLYISLSCCIAWYLRNIFRLSDAASLAVLAGLIVLGEMFWPNLFRWNLGYALMNGAMSLAQWADMVGMQGLSFMIYLINGFLLLVLLTNKRRRQIFLVLALAIFLVTMHITGEQRKTKWITNAANSESITKTISLLLVQPNLKKLERYEAINGMGYREYILNEHYALTKEGLSASPHVDLILWPENAIPDYLEEQYKEEPYPKKFREFVREIGIPILTGALSKDESNIHSENTSSDYRDNQSTDIKDKVSNQSLNEYNGLFLVDPFSKKPLQVYRKTYLLPFVENYLGLKESPLSSGQGPMLMTFREWKLGVQICFESLYASYSSELSRMGADILINATSDYWFGDTSEPWQNMFITLGRGLENRRPIVRISNSGFSAVLLADGTVLEQSPLLKRWVHQVNVPIRQQAPITFYTLYGNYLWAFILIFIMFIICLGRDKRDVLFLQNIPLE